MIYEYYRDGRLVERQEPLDQDGDAGETRIQLEVLARRESGAMDGWYEDGEWAAAEAQRAAVRGRTIAEVLDDVGDDPDKALAALRAELAQPKPRKGLVEPLQRIAEPVLAEAESADNDYDRLAEPVLNQLLAERGLPTGGNPAEKIMRLRAYDMEHEDDERDRLEPAARHEGEE